MRDNMNRRRFVKAGAGAALAVSGALPGFAQEGRKIRIGYIGVGGQGTNLLRSSLSMKDIEVPAVCDINPDHLKRAQQLVEKSGRDRPAGYGQGEEDFRRMLTRDDLDGAIIATPWEWHAAMAVETMKAGKYACTEVPGATTVQECWDLVDASEDTGMPLMMLENHSYQDNNLAVLNMIRAGLFGELIHGECGYQHDVRFTKLDDQGNLKWRGRHSVVRNGDLYTTHGLGPVAQWMDINCGNRFLYLTSTATKSRGIKHHAFRLFGPGHSSARRNYALGDIVTTVIKTARGETITINHDTNSPRPYSNMMKIQGTKGVYNELRHAVYFEPEDPHGKHREEWQDFAPYQEKYRHSYWKEFEKLAAGSGHGGTDYIKLRGFFDAVKDRKPAPVDVYDTVAWSVVSPLSEASVAKGSAPEEFPDFTRGKWLNRKPFFALDIA